MSGPLVDLSFGRIDAENDITELPTALAVVLVDVATRQAASPTARIDGRIGRIVSAPRLLVPDHGAFNLRAADVIAGWKKE